MSSGRQSESIYDYMPVQGRKAVSFQAPRMNVCTQVSQVHLGGAHVKPKAEKNQSWLYQTPTTENKKSFSRPDEIHRDVKRQNLIFFYASVFFTRRYESWKRKVCHYLGDLDLSFFFLGGRGVWKKAQPQAEKSITFDQDGGF